MGGKPRHPPALTKWLERHTPEPEVGQDLTNLLTNFGVPRKDGEPDDDYRERGRKELGLP